MNDEKWWNTIGRDMIRHRGESADTIIQQNNMNFLNPHSKNYVGIGYHQSRIATGRPYSELSPDEKMAIGNARRQAQTDADFQKKEDLRQNKLKNKNAKS